MNTPADTETTDTETTDTENTGTASTSAPADPRAAYAVATSWLTEILRGIHPDQLDAPTPCTGFDVRTLSAHVVGTGRRAVALASGVDVTTIPSVADTHDPQAYADAVAEAIELWRDDAKLAALVKVPWGEVPGAGALWGYVNETMVHAWDLAVATGQPAEGDSDVAAAALVIARQFIPAQIRDLPDVPFGPVVEPRPDAGPTEQLANWSGRRAWRR